MATTSIKTGYAPVNGLNMYYEIHGTGRPLIVLHGAFMSIASMGKLVPSLAESRQVIGIEAQGHGHTADIDRPLTYEQLADDVAAAMSYLNIEQADVFGYSLGGGTALQLAIRHPQVVRTLVAASCTFNTGGLHPGSLPAFEAITPEVFEGTPWKAEYLRIAPNPDDFPALVNKMKHLDLSPQDWPAEAIKAIPSPTLIIAGDSDGVTPEHVVEMFRLRGGGVFGDMAGMPASQLAILPGTSHVGLIERADWILPMVSAFLDAPMPETA